MRRFALPLALALLSLAFAPAPFPREDRRNRGGPGMEGTWHGFQRLEVTQTRLTYWAGNNNATYELRVDRTARPATYDVNEFGTGSRKFLGIYKVEGDTLTICYREPEKGRPTTFDGGGYLEVFK